MGVKGLWRLLLPIGRRISIEVLEGKIIAVDASIWLTQFLKAMRDPETGSVKPAAHLIGFFRRLAKLRFHGIRPVLVFEGATPMIKRRELEQRRQRRAQFAPNAEGSMQRLAKRLLIQEIKKTKQQLQLKGSIPTPGLHAQGFNLAPEDKQQSTEAVNTNEKHSNHGSISIEDDTWKEDRSENIARIMQEQEWQEDHRNSPTLNSTKFETSEEIALELQNEEWGEEQGNNAEEALSNDWDLPATDENHDYDCISEHQQKSAKSMLGTPLIRDHDGNLDVNYLTCLSTQARKDAVEKALREQRIISRKEFMPVAGQPAEYSKVQLRNFLRYTRLNKSIAKMGQETLKLGDIEGVQIASDPTRRIIFEKVDTKLSSKSDSTLRVSLESESEAGSNSLTDDYERMTTHLSARKRPRIIKVIDDSSDEEIDTTGAEVDANEHLEIPVFDSICEGNIVSGKSKNDEALDPKKFSSRDGSTKLDFLSEKLVPGDENALFEISSTDDSYEGGFLKDSAKDYVTKMTVNGAVGDCSSGVSLLKHGFASGDLNARPQIPSGNDSCEGGFFRDTGKTGVEAANTTSQPCHDFGVSRFLNDAEKIRAAETTSDILSLGNEGKYLETSGFDPTANDDSRIAAEKIPTKAPLVDLRNGYSAEDGFLLDLEQPAMKQTDKTHLSFDRPSGDVQGTEVNPSYQARSNNQGCQFDSRISLNAHVSPKLKEKTVEVCGSDVDDESVAWEEGEDMQDSETASENDDKFEEGPMKPNYAGETFDVVKDDGIKLENLVALQQAQSTAANLTNWAGRAFRRAIAQHESEALVTRTEIAKPISSSQNDSRTQHMKLLHSAFETIPVESDTTLSDKSQGKIVPSNDIRDPENAIESIKSSNDLHGTNSEHIIRGDAHEPTHHHGITGENRRTSRIDDTVTATEQLLAEEEGLELERKRQERELDTMSDEMKSEIISLIQLFGIPYTESPAEAEAQCVALESLGLVDGIVTEDSDVFVFGGRTIYRNMFDDQKYVEVYRADDAMKEMSLGRAEMVALAMLLGGDYTEGVKGVGIVNAMEILEAFPMSPNVKEGLQNFRKWLDGFDPSDADLVSSEQAEGLTGLQKFHATHMSARLRWSYPSHFPAENVLNAYLNPVVDNSTDRFSWGIPDVEELVKFCSRNIGWEASETRRMLDPVVKRLDARMVQTRLDSFMSYSDNIQFADVRSKRLRTVLKGVRKEEF